MVDPVAAPPLRRLKRAALALAALLALPAAGFPLLAWIGSSIPVNAAAPPAQAGVEIMVETNGIHTGIIVPVVSAQQDWRTIFPSAAQPRPDGHMPTHLAIGWGEREVFLNTPTWADLEAGTALRIATVGGEPVMRISHYLHPAPSENHRPIMLSEAQYARLASAIKAALPAPAPGTTRTILRGSDSHDAYYEANGEYTLATTCNSWVGEALAQAGVPMGWWTPFAGGVMKWVPVAEPG